MTDSKSHNSIQLLSASLVIVLGALLCSPPLYAADTPDGILESQTRVIIERLESDGGAATKTPEQLDEVVNTYLLPLIDFEAMSKLTLGVNWRKASETQRTDFVEAYKTLLANTYTSFLNQFSGQEMKYQNEKTKIDGTYATVYSEYIPGNGQPNLTVKYSMRNVDGQWKVYDVAVDGLSFIKNYRTSFTTEISQDGLDALIERLRAGKVAVDPA